MKPVICEYYRTYLKAAEGGMALGWVVKMLKDAGIRAKQYSSCYVGHHELWIEKGKKTKARKILKSYGL